MSGRRPKTRGTGKKKRLSKKKVLLSGAGGDDIFSGYRRHQAIEIDSYMDKIPKILRSKFKDLIQKLPSNSNFLRRLKKYTRYFDLDGNDKIISYFNWIDKDTRRNLFSSDVKSYLDKMLVSLE